MMPRNDLKEQLKTKPFFFKEPIELFDTNESNAKTYAQENINQLLTLAIPSTTFGIGANPIGTQGIMIESKNMNAQGSDDNDIKTNGWPKSRIDKKDLMWKHNDYQDVSFVYTNRLYKYIVETGGLK